MAAEIRRRSAQTVRKPVLVNKIEGVGDDLNAACLIRREEGVISLSDDRTVRVWLKRDSGQYWPSICQTLQSKPVCLYYSDETRRLFVGLDNGTITEYAVSEDYNRMSHQRDFLAHQNTVNGVLFSLTSEWLLSCGKDKYFQWYCSESGRRLGGYQCDASALCLEFDDQSRYVFLGLYSGHVVVIRIKNDSCEVITTLKGHSGSVRCLAWDKDRSLLFSGSFDQSIIVWDIGGQQGTAFELQGHKARLISLYYSDLSKQLISVGDDNSMIFWDMDVKRKETPMWKESDICEICEVPFLWNFRRMWESKVIGNRQHHCRKCGRAICHGCSTNTSTLPNYGFEYAVRMCDECYKDITDDDQAPLATIHDTRHTMACMHVDERKRSLITVGRDRVIKPMKSVGGVYKLSPNEEARVIREEKERRRKQRIVQVRQQSSRNAANVRSEVRAEKQRQITKLATKVERELDGVQSEKVRELERNYDNCVKSIGEGHSSADRQPLAEKQRQATTEYHEEQSKIRSKAAWDRHQRDRLVQDADKNKTILARTTALNTERKRAAHIASLPPPHPDPLADIIPAKVTRPVGVTDTEAFSSTHYHVPKDTVVFRASPTLQEQNATEAAEDEVVRREEDEKTKKSLHEERMERARVRHIVAREKELLKQDYDVMLHDLSDLQREDRRRRQKVVDRIPRQVFVPPHKRLMDDEERKRDIETEFEDMYMKATDQAGDLTMALDAQPLTPTPTDDLDLSTVDPPAESVDTASQLSTVQSAISKGEETLSQATNIISDIARNKKTDGVLSKLMSKIKSQQEEWTRESEETAEKTQMSPVGTSVSDKENLIPSVEKPTVTLPKDTPVLPMDPPPIIPDHPQGDVSHDVSHDSDARSSEIDLILQQKREILEKKKQLEQRIMEMESRSPRRNKGIKPAFVFPKTASGVTSENIPKLPEKSQKMTDVSSENAPNLVDISTKVTETKPLNIVHSDQQNGGYSMDSNHKELHADIVGTDSDRIRQYQQSLLDRQSENWKNYHDTRDKIERRRQDLLTQYPSMEIPKFGVPDSPRRVVTSTLTRNILGMVGKPSENVPVSFHTAGITSTSESKRQAKSPFDFSDVSSIVSSTQSSANEKHPASFQKSGLTKDASLGYVMKEKSVLTEHDSDEIRKTLSFSDDEDDSIQEPQLPHKFPPGVDSLNSLSNTVSTLSSSDYLPNQDVINLKDAAEQRKNYFESRQVELEKKLRAVREQHSAVGTGSKDTNYNKLITDGVNTSQNEAHRVQFNRITGDGPDGKSRKFSPITEQFLTSLTHDENFENDPRFGQAHHGNISRGNSQNFLHSSVDPQEVLREIEDSFTKYDSLSNTTSATTFPTSGTSERYYTAATSSGGVSYSTSTGPLPYISASDNFHLPTSSASGFSAAYTSSFGTDTSKAAGLKNNSICTDVISSSTLSSGTLSSATDVKQPPVFSGTYSAVPFTLSSTAHVKQATMLESGYSMAPFNLSSTNAQQFNLSSATDTKQAAMLESGYFSTAPFNLSSINTQHFNASSANTQFNFSTDVKGAHTQHFNVSSANTQSSSTTHVKGAPTSPDSSPETRYDRPPINMTRYNLTSHMPHELSLIHERDSTSSQRTSSQEYHTRISQASYVSDGPLSSMHDDDEYFANDATIPFADGLTIHSTSMANRSHEIKSRQNTENIDLHSQYKHSDVRNDLDVIAENERSQDTDDFTVNLPGYARSTTSSSSPSITARRLFDDFDSQSGSSRSNGLIHQPLSGSSTTSKELSDYAITPGVRNHLTEQQYDNTSRTNSNELSDYPVTPISSVSNSHPHDVIHPHTSAISTSWQDATMNSWVSPSRVPNLRSLDSALNMRSPNRYVKDRPYDPENTGIRYDNQDMMYGKLPSSVQITDPRIQLSADKAVKEVFSTDKTRQGGYMGDNVTNVHSLKLNSHGDVRNDSKYVNSLVRDDESGTFEPLKSNSSTSTNSLKSQTIDIVSDRSSPSDHSIGASRSAASGMSDEIDDPMKSRPLLRNSIQDNAHSVSYTQAQVFDTSTLQKSDLSNDARSWSDVLMDDHMKVSRNQESTKHLVVDKNSHDALKTSGSVHVGVSPAYHRHLETFSPGRILQETNLSSDYQPYIHDDPLNRSTVLTPTKSAYEPVFVGMSSPSYRSYLSNSSPAKLREDELLNSKIDYQPYLTSDPLDQKSSTALRKTPQSERVHIGVSPLYKSHKSSPRRPASEKKPQTPSSPLIERKTPNKLSKSDDSFQSYTPKSIKTLTDVSPLSQHSIPSPKQTEVTDTTSYRSVPKNLKSSANVIPTDSNLADPIPPLQWAVPSQSESVNSTWTNKNTKESSKVPGKTETASVVTKTLSETKSPCRKPGSSVVRSYSQSSSHKHSRAQALRYQAEVSSTTQSSSHSHAQTKQSTSRTPITSHTQSYQQEVGSHTQSSSHSRGQTKQHSSHTSHTPSYQKEVSSHTQNSSDSRAQTKSSSHTPLTSHTPSKQSSIMSQLPNSPRTPSTKTRQLYPKKTLTPRSPRTTPSIQTTRTDWVSSLRSPVLTPKPYVNPKRIHVPKSVPLGEYSANLAKMSKAHLALIMEKAQSDVQKAKRVNDRLIEQQSFTEEPGISDEPDLTMVSLRSDQSMLHDDTDDANTHGDNQTAGDDLHKKQKTDDYYQKYIEKTSGYTKDSEKILQKLQENREYYKNINNNGNTSEVSSGSINLDEESVISRELIEQTLRSYSDLLQETLKSQQELKEQTISTDKQAIFDFHGDVQKQTILDEKQTTFGFHDNMKKQTIHKQMILGEKQTTFGSHGDTQKQTTLGYHGDRSQEQTISSEQTTLSTDDLEEQTDEDLSESLMSFMQHETSVMKRRSEAGNSDHFKAPETFSLQDAFLAKKSHFIKDSQKRVADAKDAAPKMATTVASWKRNRSIKGVVSTKALRKSLATPTRDRDKLDRKKQEKDNKNRNNRLYLQLEEVKKKNESIERQKQYAANREKAKEYHNKLQEKRKKKPTKKT